MAFFFLANDPALDFVNTSFLGGDVLDNFAAYIDWLRAASLLTVSEARDAAKAAGAVSTRSAFKSLLALRAAIRRCAEAVSSDRLPSKADLRTINDHLTDPPVQRELLISDGQLTGAERLSSTVPERLLYFVAASADELLTQKDATAIRQCAGDECTHFFYDASKNRSRRWCSMAACGNRDKVAALRQRLRDREQSLGA